MSHVDLGFVEKCENWLLQSNHFPSKVGGKPSWLNLKELPNSEDLSCKKCNKTMVFLCQIYAPIENKNTCFHRTIFIFICRNESCCQQNDNTNIIVLRSQLSRENDYYSAEPPDEKIKTHFEIETFTKTCTVCGIFAAKHCSKCKTTSYCSREHQIIDWRFQHKRLCGSDQPEVSNLSILFEEFEIVIEPEEIKSTSEKKKETPEESEARRLKEYEDLISKGTLAEVSESELDCHAAIDEDKTFFNFRKKISSNPDQVLRYNREGDPIWIASDPKPTEIPLCEYCNGERKFEFQILPQLLFSLKENNLDWGVLIVYTCKESCDLGPCYKKEFVFKQDVATKE